MSKEKKHEEKVKESPSKEKEEVMEEVEIEEEKPNQEMEQLKQENKELQEKVDILKNEYARAYADTENMKKRLQNEFDQKMKYHIQDFAKEVIPVIDNCERALALEVKDEADENYRKGFEMVKNQLWSSLQKEGVEEIEALGLPFDPNWHQAMLSEHQEGVEEGIVLEVLQKGYKLKDRLLRPAMVKISE
ncbi:MAG: nucleotide exchange factor GrpE [Solobacterium sp.]|nr:nucleotide exchange factor GrpE [Solobacterium sp.]